MAANGVQAIYQAEDDLKASQKVVKVSKVTYDVAKFMAKEEDRSVRSIMDKAIRELKSKHNPLYKAQDRKADETKLNNTGDTYE